MQKGKSYIKDSGNFINKIKKLQDTLDGVILVTADVLGRYISISHEAGLRALKEDFNINRERKSIAIENLTTAGFVLKLILSSTEKLNKKC